MHCLVLLFGSSIVEESKKRDVRKGVQESTKVKRDAMVFVIFVESFEVNLI